MLWTQKREYSGFHQGVERYWTAVLQVEVLEQGGVYWEWGLYRGTLEKHSNGDVFSWQSQEDPKLLQWTIKKVKEIGRLLFSILEARSINFPELLEAIHAMSVDEMLKKLEQEKQVSLHLIAFPH